jgi:hypothetical protein
MQYSKIPDLLDNLLTTSMAEAARRVGISARLPWHWMVQSRLGKDELQDIEWMGVHAPFHEHCQNAKTLMAQQIEQSAIERARDGCMVDVFFQGVRQHEKKLKPEFESRNEDELWIEVGPEWEKVCYEMVPTKQWLKPSDALVLKMVEAWNRKRYGNHQSIDVTYGGVLRLERPDEKVKIIEHRPEVFEDATESEADGGHHLALARPANTSEEMDKWAAAGEFAPAPVTFVNAKGERTELRADIEELRAQAEALKRNGPVHKRPEGKVEVFKPDAPADKAVVAEDGEPEPQTLADHPRAYYVDKLSPPRRPPPYSGGDMGSGREGIGRGPDPSRDGKHQGFPMTRG